MYVTYTRIYGWSDYGGESSYQPGYRLENMMWMTLLVYDYIIPEEKIIISVSNPTEYIPFSEIENMFVCGYSSKGENRGIGLSRVKELANKYEANIKVSNFWYDEENWINFTVEIVK